jgi:hypothetical protein
LAPQLDNRSTTGLRILGCPHMDSSPATIFASLLRSPNWRGTAHKQSWCAIGKLMTGSLPVNDSVASQSYAK